MTSPGAAARHSPASERNRGPILAVLERVLPARGIVLEVGSGTGQHVAHFASGLPALRWQPSDASGEGFASIAAWVEAAGAANVAPPIVLDATSDSWPVGTVEAIFCANVVHIAPWAVALGLLRGAGRHLAAGGVLVLYGPFRIGGEHTAPSNAAFDADLRARDPRWGVRDLEAVADAAREQGLELAERVPMPANNLTLVFRRGGERGRP